MEAANEQWPATAPQEEPQPTGPKSEISDSRPEPPHRSTASMTIKWRVVSIILAVGSLLSITEMAIFMFIDSYTFRENKIRGLQLLAEVVGENSSSPLVFQDHGEAEKVLRTLRHNPTVKSAYLMDNRGGHFASYLAEGEEMSIPLLTPEFRKLKYSNGYPLVIYDIQSDKTLAGTLVLSASLEDLEERKRKTLLIGGSIALLFFGVAFVLALWAEGYLTSPIRDLAATIRHITESSDYSLRAPKKSDDELGELIGGFNHMLSEIQRRDSELARQIKAVALTNKELDQFVYVASHDLKAPLRAIDNLSQLIQKAVGSALPEDKAELLTLMRGRIKRMGSLLDDLLAYSRIGRIQAKIETVSLTSLFQDVVHLLAPPEGFQITIPENLPTIRAVHTPLEQVVRNLIGNAIKHHPDPSHGLIEVAVHSVGKFLEISICDNGAGIPEQYHQKIFQMFQTLRPRDEVEGSGMGLAMVKKIVEDQGGRVWLTSDIGRGSCFFFTWPKEPREKINEV